MRPLVALALASCAYTGSYHDLTGPFPGHRVALGCLDLAVTLTEDQLAPPPIVEYSFGNHCTHATIVDLPSVHAVGRFDDGSVAELTARDPEHELAALPIDGWWHGQEEISYASGNGRVPRIVCLDVGRVDHSSDGSSRWVCLQ